ncbi:MAG: AMP-binding protein [Desulfamplus sp.]|nr:AMP-binding protein [Desulfamplus sp.]
MIKRNALLFPDDIAIVEGEKSLTFSEFFLKVNMFASKLSGYGVLPHKSVAVLSMNKTEYLALYGATSAIGAMLVPLNWRLSLDELSYIIKDSGSKVLFFDSTQSEQAFSLKKLSEVSASKFSLTLVAFDENYDENRCNRNRDETADCKFTPFLHNPDDIFTLIYTAAVAGKPRGAALSHNNIIASNLQTCLTMNLGKSDSYLNMLPLFHITGMNLSLAVMQMGGKNVIMEKFNVQDALSMIEKEKVTLMASFPPILNNLLDEFDKNIYDISSLKNTVGIDSPQNVTKFCEKTSSKFWVLYGQSETSGFVTLSDSSECIGSAGRQCCISNMAIVDENDMVLPSGQSGEIAVRGPLVFQGFWKNDSSKDEKSDGSTIEHDRSKLQYDSSTIEHDSSRMQCDSSKVQYNKSIVRYDRSTIRNGWHHTGDIGHIDSNGYLWFEGRKPEKELIKPGGENVYPAEVEAVVLEHSDIEATCVIGVPDPKFGEGVKAVCVKKIASNLTAKELIEFVGSRIARYKKPSSVEFVESLPRKSDGSVDRKRVKEIYGC